MEVTETAYTYDGKRPFWFVKYPEMAVDHEAYRTLGVTVLEGSEGVFLFRSELTVSHSHAGGPIYDFGGSEPDPATKCECCGRFNVRPKQARSLREAAEKGYVSEIRWAD